MAMLDGTLPFNEGAYQVTKLRHHIGGVAERDEDFDIFIAIESETDHLPLKAQFALWQTEALERLAPEFERTQAWASQFAPAACASLVNRFKE